MLEKETTDTKKKLGSKLNHNNNRLDRYGYVEFKIMVLIFKTKK